MSPKLLEPGNRPTELWIPSPGKYLEDDDVFSSEYPAAKVSELIDEWERAWPTDEMAKIPEIYGIYKKINQEVEQPKLVVSIDVDEILRLASRSLQNIRTDDNSYNIKPSKVFSLVQTKDIKNVHRLVKATLAERNVEAPARNYPNPDVPEHVVGQMVVALMNAEYVQPVEGISAIAEIIEEWSKLGVYSVLTTSTLPGAEKSTIRFMKKYVPKGLSGILLPRNHDGKGELTKARAIQHLLALPQFEEVSTVIHIDDASHHNDPFHDEFSDSNVSAHTYTPIYAQDLNGEVHNHDERTFVAIHASDPYGHPRQVFEDVDKKVRKVLRAA